MLRVLGYWLLYAVVGTLVLAMVLGGGGDLGSEDAKSPIRTRTKVVGAASGAALAAALVGWFLLRDPAARSTWPTAMVAAGAPLAVLLTIWAWIWIAGDLARRRRRARA